MPKKGEKKAETHKQPIKGKRKRKGGSKIATRTARRRILEHQAQEPKAVTNAKNMIKEYFPRGTFPSNMYVRLI
jgi:hypothetical protein